MSILIISIPLSSAILTYMLGRKIGYRGGRVISIGSMLINICLSAYMYRDYAGGQEKALFIKEWFNVGQQSTSFELVYTKEGVLMLLLISLITAVVISYSYWYLGGDAHQNRFIGYLLLFAVAMYVLVFSKNYLQIFLGWEGVGVISYLLINFWYSSIGNNKAAIKALLFNKVGDIAYIYAIVALMYIGLDTNTSLVFNPSYTGIYMSIIYALVIASMAKSAQIILHCWLGDAMAGPTPVSALLHAATMVTAGIYLLLKISPLLHLVPEVPLIPLGGGGEGGVRGVGVGEIIVLIGLITIVFGGVSSLYQYDIKKIIAYSTCAQIGYMFYGISYLVPTYSSLYHLITHGFFKALLFLSAGLLIHNLLLEQDIRKYGSLVFTYPLFYLSFLIGTLAIIGIPMLAGYYSKDIIILQAYTYKSLGMSIILILGSLLSSLYSLRLLSLSFFTPSHTPTLTNHPISLRDYRWLVVFALLYLGSFSGGYLFNDILGSPYLLSLDTEFFLALSPFSKTLLLALPPISFFFIFISNSSLLNPLASPLGVSLIPYFNRRFFFDTFYNYFVSLPLLLLSYHFAYKTLDRGYLEALGPLGLLRVFYTPYSLFNLHQQKISSLPFVFFFFFLSLGGLALTSLLFAL